MDRPTSSETEDDLLRLQEEFLSDPAKTNQPAVKVVKRKTAAAVINNATKQKNERKKFRLSGDEDDAECLMDSEDRHITTILANIVEHERPTFVALPRSSLSSVTGMPQALHRGNITSSSSVGDHPVKRKSVFAQQMAGLHPTKAQSVIASVDQSIPKKSTAQDLSSSALVTGQGLCDYAAGKEAQSIHSENMNRLQSLSAEEILTEQERIRQSLDPALLKFIEQRRNSTLKGGQQLPIKPAKTVSSVACSSNQHREPNIDVTDLPIRPDPNVPHLDKVEADKLAWMRSVQTPDSKTTQGSCQARFDFDGNLMSPSEDVPTHLGLHHHGDEPERAGYTLDELYTLCRSSSPPQRLLALTCLSSVLYQSRAGHHPSLSCPLLPSLLSSGLPFLARWTLDDTLTNSPNPADVHGAVTLLHAMLCSPQDEVLLDQSFHWSGKLGLVMPSLEPQKALSARLSAAKEVDSEKTEQTDGDLMSLDVVVGLVDRTDLLTRVVWMLERVRLTPDSMPKLMEVLIRVARHSRSTAYKLSQTKKLVTILVKHFLPLHWKSQAKDDEVAVQMDQVMDAYGKPLPDLVKLLRVLCQSSYSLTLRYNSEFSLYERCMNYLGTDFREIGLPIQVAQRLQLESLRLLTVFAAYSIKLAAIWTSLPALLSLYHSCVTHWSQSAADETRQHSEELLTAWITLFDTLLRTIQSRQEIDNDVIGLLNCCTELCWKLVDRFLESYHLESYPLDLTAACVQLTCDLCAVKWSHASSNPAILLQDLTTIWGRYLHPLFSSVGFEHLILQQRRSSLLLLNDHKATLSPVLLTYDGLLDPGMKVTLHQQADHPSQLLYEDMSRAYASSVDWCTPTAHVALLTSLVCLSNQIALRCKEPLNGHIVESVLLKPDVMSTLRRLLTASTLPVWVNTSEGSGQAAPWAVIFELDMVTRLVCLSSAVPNTENSSTEQLELCHRLALRLLPQLLQGQADIAKEVLIRVVFNPMHVMANITPTLTEMSLNQSDLAVNLLADINENLVPLRICYLNILHSGPLKDSVDAIDSSWKPPECLTIINGGLEDRLLPVDWMYLPLLVRYQMSLDTPDQLGSDEMSPSKDLIHCLRWVHYLEQCRSPLHNVSLATRLTRLATSFLLSSELFLDSVASRFIHSLLGLLVGPTSLHRLDLEQKIPGVAGFYDIFVELVTQYQAVSYGDATFANLILLPCHQRHHVKYRRALWGEHRVVLRSITLPFNKLLTTVSNFLEPVETSWEMIHLYTQALLSPFILQPCRNPLPYLLAVHHVNRFLFDQSNPSKEKTEYQKSLIGQFVSSTLLRDHVIRYQQADVNNQCELGFTMYSDIPAIRRTQLDRLGVVL